MEFFSFKDSFSIIDISTYSLKSNEHKIQIKNQHSQQRKILAHGLVKFSFQALYFNITKLCHRMYRLNEKLLLRLGPLSSHCLRIFEKRAEQIDSGIHQENFYYREIFILKH